MKAIVLSLLALLCSVGFAIADEPTPKDCIEYKGHTYCKVPVVASSQSVIELGDVPPCIWYKGELYCRELKESIRASGPTDPDWRCLVIPKKPIVCGESISHIGRSGAVCATNSEGAVHCGSPVMSFTFDPTIVCINDDDCPSRGIEISEAVAAALKAVLEKARE